MIRALHPPLFTLMIVLALPACPNRHKRKADAATKQPAETGVVVLEPAGRTIRLKVEVMRTPRQRERGMMFRKELAPMAGMLFVFSKQTIQSFWMQNTYIPLDMIFINGAMEIVGVVENAEPMTTSSRQVNEPSLYTLEVNGGFCKKHGIDRKTVVRFELTPPKVRPPS